SSRCGWNRAVPSSVPPVGNTLRTSERFKVMKSPSATPFQPLRNPTTEWPYASSPCFTTARIAAFSPGQSPPPVKTPMRTRDSFSKLSKLAYAALRGLDSPLTLPIVLRISATKVPRAALHESERDDYKP